MCMAFCSQIYVCGQPKVVILGQGFCRPPEIKVAFSIIMFSFTFLLLKPTFTWPCLPLAITLLVIALWFIILFFKKKYLISIDPRVPVLVTMFQCQLFFIYQALVFSTTWPSRGVRHEVRNKSDAQVTSRDLMGEIHQYQRHLVSGDFGKFRLCLVSLPSDWTGVARRWNLSSPDTFCVHPWYL